MSSSSLSARRRAVRVNGHRCTGRAIGRFPHWCGPAPDDAAGGLLTARLWPGAHYDLWAAPSDGAVNIWFCPHRQAPRRCAARDRFSVGPTSFGRFKLGDGEIDCASVQVTRRTDERDVISGLVPSVGRR